MVTIEKPLYYDPIRSSIQQESLKLKLKLSYFSIIPTKLIVDVVIVNYKLLLKDVQEKSKLIFSLDSSAHLQ
jgi:hypothetical protein